MARARPLRARDRGRRGRWRLTMAPAGAPASNENGLSHYRKRDQPPFRESRPYQRYGRPVQLLFPLPQHHMINKPREELAGLVHCIGLGGSAHVIRIYGSRCGAWSMLSPRRVLVELGYSETQQEKDNATYQRRS